MRFLGIDYGTKRIGIALSDEEGVLAFPKEILPNDARCLEKIGKIIREENINQAVIGESLDFEGEKNKISDAIEMFTEALKENFHIKVHTQKEFLTSVEARRYSQEGQKVDASAAALILQRYLDKRNTIK